MNAKRLFNIFLIILLAFGVATNLAMDIEPSIAPVLKIVLLGYMAMMGLVLLLLKLLVRLRVIPEEADARKAEAPDFVPPPPEPTAIIELDGSQPSPTLPAPLRPIQRPISVPTIRRTTRRSRRSEIVWPFPDFTLKGGVIPLKEREGWVASWTVAKDKKE